MKHARLLWAFLVVGLLGMGGAFAQATRLDWATPASGAAPGQPFQTQPVIQAVDASGAIDYSYNGPVTVSLDPATATGGAVLLGTKTVNIEGGTAIFTDLAITVPGSYVLKAKSGTLSGDSSVTVVVSFGDAWNKQLPNDTDPTQTVNGWNQIRAFAVNSNPGSPWAGTMYLPRRAATNTHSTPPNIAGTSDVFFWKAHATNPAAAPGSGTLTAQGPDYANPDGRFVNPATLPSNAWWGIGVAGDDYVYAAGLNGGVLYRFNPDGTNPTQVATGFATISGANKFVRSLTVTGKGADTTIWYVFGDANPNVEKWVASGSPADPTSAFTKAPLFSVTTADNTGGQKYQLVLNSAKTTAYYVGNFGSGPVAYDVATGAKIAGFPAWTLAGGSGLAIDSQDRMLVEGYYLKNQIITAFSPRNGQNIADKNDGTLANGGFYVPPVLQDVQVYNSNGIEMARFSDRHYFWLESNSDNASYPTTPVTGTYNGVVATNMPAPSPLNVAVANPGTGNTLNVSWTLPNDPEAVGVKVYVSTSPSSLGTAVNGGNTLTASPYTLTGLTLGTTYYITVRTVAVDPFKTGADATYESADLTPVAAAPTLPSTPDAPANQTATDTKKGGEVLLGWTNPVTNADTIRIYRSNAAGQLGAIAKTFSNITPSAAMTWTDTDLTNGTAYYYTIRAFGTSESVNTTQLAVTPTDTTAPTFAGLTAIKDWGYPGFALSWNAATDNSAVTYEVFATDGQTSFNYAAPVQTVTGTSTVLSGLTVGQKYYFTVRAVDAYGNMDANTRVISGQPSRVILDPDVNAEVNWSNINFQPDTAFPALVPSAIGGAKGGADDLKPSSFAVGSNYQNTNDKKGKVLYSVPINAAGTYDIAADWLNNPEVQAPHVGFTVTLPNGTVLPTVYLDETGNTDSTNPNGNGSQWNLISTQALTAGTMTVLYDATTSTDSDPTHINVAPAIRALMQIPPATVTIVKAATAPTVDGNITSAEWSGASDILLGTPFQDLIPGNWTGPKDYTAHVYTKWDDNALYIGEVVNDDVLSFNAPEPKYNYNADSLELYVGLDPNASPTRTSYSFPGDYQVLMSATPDGSGGYTGNAYSPQAGLSGATVAVKPFPGGYTLEAALPWTGFDGWAAAPTQGQTIGFNLHGNDDDQATPAQDSAFSLSEKAGSWQNPQSWIQAVIAGAPTSVKGDINGDGRVDMLDVQAGLRIVSGLSVGSLPARINGDVAGAGTDGRTPDGKLTMADILRIERVVNGKDTL